MRVAFDVGPVLRAPTGVGRYAGELGRALEARGVTLRRYAISWNAPSAQGVTRWRVPARLVQSAWLRFGRPIPNRLVGGSDVVHATNFVLPPCPGAAGVVTVHDLSFYRDDVFPGGDRLRELVPWSLGRASRVIVPTAAIRAEVTERFGFPVDRIDVTYEGVAPVFFGAAPLSETALGKMGIPGPFVLAVGTIEPRKNLVTLLRAWRTASDALEGWRLVLAGPRGWGPELPETSGVIPLGYVGDETLPGLMSAADIFCYPSHYEGFGLPPLEAMAAGTACIVGRYTAAEEVLGDSAILVDPGDVDGLARSLVDLAVRADTRREMALMGRSRAATYTWERTAAATHEVYRAALAT